ncbi:MAG: CPBP family glutamic-type intramembrane protease [Verrucomicrobiota bacterium]
MKDTARLAAYFAATILIGALIAPPLFWFGQWVSANGWLPFLAKFDFETFFHRSLIIAAVALFWPFLYFSNVRNLADLSLAPNQRWIRDLATGFLVATIPLLCCGALLVALHVSQMRHVFQWPAFGRTVLASITVPFIEEALFRGLILGLLLRSGRTYLSILATSALFAVVHFLKAPAGTSIIVTWTSGFNSIAHSFAQFADPMFVLAAFTTLFLIGWILADARVRTRSLWLPIGLHSGWIFANGAFNAMARREVLALPWLGKNLLVGIVPLGVGALTWLLIIFLYERTREN